MIIKEVYQCEWCSFESRVEERTLLHEEACDKNPDNRTCLTCPAFSIEKKTCLYGIEIFEGIKRNCKKWERD